MIVFGVGLDLILDAVGEAYANASFIADPISAGEFTT